MPRSEPEKRRALGQERTLHPVPERVRAAVFVKHPAFFDACDELQVKYEMLRAHFLDGEPVTTVCAAFGYSRQTFYLLRDRLARRGLAGLRDARPGPVGPRTCTPAVVAFLRAQRADDPALPISVLLDRLQRTHGVRLHRRTVERVMGGGPRKKTPRGGEPVADADACTRPGAVLRGWRSGPSRIRAAAGRFPGLGPPRRSGAPGRARPRGSGRAPHTPSRRVDGALCGRAPVALDRSGRCTDDRVG